MRVLLKIFSILFTVELILGFNGKLLMVGSLSIRYLLYTVVLTILLAVIADLTIKGSISLNPKSHNSILSLYDGLDLALAAFLLLNLVWVFIVPCLSGVGIKLAIKEVASLSILVLYFPIVILIKTDYIKWEKALTLIKICAVLVSILHIVLYFGERIVGDASFQLGFFGLIERLTLGHSHRPLVMMPKNYIRIIYPAAIYFVILFYFTLKSELSVKDMIFYVIALLASFTPLTKSLWFGIGGAMLFYVVMCLVEQRKHEPMYGKHRLGILIVITLVSTLAFNYLFFDNYIFIRVINSFEVASECPDYDGDTTVLDESGSLDRFNDELEGTKRSNYTRIEQIEVLIEKWKERPLFGFGYGSYVEERPGVEATPYSYEMFLPALLMKIGIVGLLVWLSFVTYLFCYTYKKNSKHRKHGYAVMFIIIALGLSTQFNPYLINACGMGTLLFALLELKAGTSTLPGSQCH
jgi:hypothetical protein